VRCRVRAGAVVIELDEAALAALDATRRDVLSEQIVGHFGRTGVRAPVRFEVYRTGSAFLHFKPG
jgi:uncharacterized protein